MKELYKSPVIFEEDRAAGVHEYWLGFETLSGVTSILKAVLFPGKYADIDPEVLRRAADRGIAIHEAVQCWQMGRDEWPYLPEYETDMEQALDSFRAMIAEHDELMAVADEYMVSNEQDVASKVDLVYHGLDGWVLTDIKTTSSCDEEYLSWQLSVYKVFFERQNPSKKVAELVGLWYNRNENRWYWVPVRFKGEEAVEALIEAFRNGDVWNEEQRQRW